VEFDEAVGSEEEERDSAYGFGGRCFDGEGVARALEAVTVDSPVELGGVDGGGGFVSTTTKPPSVARWMQAYTSRQCELLAASLIDGELSAWRISSLT